MKCVKGILILEEFHNKEIHKKSLNNLYKKSSTLGAVSFGIVRKIVHKKAGKSYASKYIKKIKSEDNWLPEILHEIAILKRFKSKNIVKLHEVFETRSHITLIMDLLAGGNLQSVLENMKYMPEVDVKTIIIQVLESVHTLHAQNIIYIDIKLENILLSKPKCFENIKLCDFGHSMYLEPGEELRSLNGTLDYMSPEVLTKVPISKKSDIWSIVLALTYCLLSGYLPFSDEDDEDTKVNIRKGIVEFEEDSFKSISVECINFIKSTLVLDPKLRPSVNELKQHEWFSTGKCSL